LSALEKAPDQALPSFERWLLATSSPTLALEQALDMPEGFSLMLRLMAASQPLADTLIQNPELAALVLDRAERSQLPSKDDLLREGRTLLASATSPSHALDRLRFLKQRWTVPIVANDVSGLWEPEKVWVAISTLAEALLELAAESIWDRFSQEKQIDLPCPLAVVAFGKLGGQELNYSSDIDLVFVAPENLPAELKANLARYAELLSRSLSERSGRGSMYRVDLRLRPYGNAGPLVPSMDAVESYYALYAEPWEVQALLRSRVVISPSRAANAGQDFKERWSALVDRVCFRPTLGEPAIEAMVAMRSRIEEHSTPDDLKRGRGGIRDVEFLVQILQLVHGYEERSVRVRPTVDAIEALLACGYLPEATAQNLAEGYRFLRQLEHRCQLLTDQQTHRLPGTPEGQAVVADLMDLGGAEDLLLRLDGVRQRISEIYDRFLSGTVHPPTAREQLMLKLDPDLSSWLDGLPESEGYYGALLENQSSLERLEELLAAAPALLPRVRGSLSVLELVLSGEIEDTDPQAVAELRRQDVEDLEAQAPAFVAAATRLAVAWSLSKPGAPSFDLGIAFTKLAEQVLLAAAQKVAPQLELIALGSFARRELTLESDADVLFLVPDGLGHAEAEEAAQALLRLTGRLHRQGVPISLDLRLRPDGGKGLLVRTYEAIRAYERDGMELWERFALGQSRLLSGAPEAQAVIDTAAYALPLTSERLTELLSIKARIENERVKPQHRWRNVKLGFGGLGDLEWFVHLHEMRYPPAFVGTKSKEERPTSLKERIQRLRRTGFINAAEAIELETGREHLMRLRQWLVLQGISNDVMPENPDKLNRLAKACGSPDGNALLLSHQAVTSRVREIYEEGLTRLVQ
jgi:glutamate-ammonia-ligase adenylyltransferase